MVYVIDMNPADFTHSKIASHMKRKKNVYIMYFVKNFSYISSLDYFLYS